MTTTNAPLDLMVIVDRLQTEVDELKRLVHKHLKEERNFIKSMSEGKL